MDFPCSGGIDEKKKVLGVHMSQLDVDNINAACAARSWLNPVRWLLRIGIVRPHHDGTSRLRWPFHWGPKHCWIYLWKTPGQRVGVFRNGIFIRDVGTWLPRRWGFYILGFEIGQRG